MKKITICIMFLAFTMGSFSQSVNPELPLTREDYLIKSKNQQETAWILLGTGTVAIGTGMAIAYNPYGELDDGVYSGLFIMLGGLIMDVISIPFFISASSNKRKGMDALTFIKLETSPPELRNISGYPVLPTASVKVRF